MEKFREVEARRRAEDEERAREKEITEQKARQEIEMRKGKKYERRARIRKREYEMCASKLLQHLIIRLSVDNHCKTEFY